MTDNRSSARPIDAALPKLEDVAATAGVSTATVSRCLNTPDRVSEATRERVMAAVRSLGYAPNFGARALAARRTNTFGAVIPTMENAIFARGLQAFQEELEKHGITLLVASSSYSPQLEQDQLHTLVARGADALLLIGHDRTPDSYTFLEKRKIPYVVAWAHDPTQTRASIGFDNKKAMQALAREVLALGHRDLALISAPRAENDRARARADGVLAAMQAAGLDPETLTIIETPYGIANGATAFESLLTESPRPTAILCGNDVMAAGALTKARDLGIEVPRDLSITGFDDIELAELVVPALTTVHVPHRTMGRRAAQLLLALWDEAHPAKSTQLDASVTVRASLGRDPR